jgi:hypothetical protein
LAVFGWLRSQVDQHGLFKVLWAPAAIVLAVGGFATLFSSNLGIGLFIALAMVLFAAVVFLGLALADNATLRADQAELKRSLKTLRRYVVSELPVETRTVQWRDQQIVRRNGDTFMRVEMTIRVEGDRPLHFVETVQNGEALSPREQKAMRLTARREPGGARLPIDWEWVDASSLRFWTHFERPIQPGNDIALSYEFTWPHTLPNLTRRGIEHVEWEAQRPTDHFEAEIRLDAELGRRTDLRLTAHGIKRESISQGPDGDAWTVRASIDNLAVGHRVSLDLDAG